MTNYCAPIPTLHLAAPPQSLMQCQGLCWAKAQAPTAQSLEIRCNGPRNNPRIRTACTARAPRLMLPQKEGKGSCKPEATVLPRMIHNTDPLARVPCSWCPMGYGMTREPTGPIPLLRAEQSHAGPHCHTRGAHASTHTQATQTNTRTNTQTRACHCDRGSGHVPHDPPRMATCELSRVGCCLKRRQQQISTCRSQEGGKSLSRAETDPRRLSQKVCGKVALGVRPIAGERRQHQSHCSYNTRTPQRMTDRQSQRHPPPARRGCGMEHQRPSHVRFEKAHGPVRPPTPSALLRRAVHSPPTVLHSAHDKPPSIAPPRPRALPRVPAPRAPGSPRRRAHCRAAGAMSENGGRSVLELGAPVPRRAPHRGSAMHMELRRTVSVTRLTYMRSGVLPPRPTPPPPLCMRTGHGSAQ